MDYQECEGTRTDCRESSEVMEVTDWTPWVKSNSSVDGAWYEKRFRFSYRSAGSSGAGNNDLQEEERQPVQHFQGDERIRGPPCPGQTPSSRGAGTAARNIRAVEGSAASLRP